MQDSPEPLHDDELLDLVRSAMSEAAALPLEVAVAARAAFELRAMDVELAALIYDSRNNDRLLAGTRAADSARVMVFRTGESTVEVEFADGRALGQVDPPPGGTVVLESPQGRLGEAEVDSVGCFIIAGDFTGMIRISLCTDDRPTLVSEWARL